MLIAITANGEDLTSPFERRFSRCQYFIFYDTETREIVDVVDNPEVETFDGGGTAAGQVIVGHDAEALVTGDVDPDAGDILAAGDVTVYLCLGGAVQSVIDRFLTGDLELRPGPQRGFNPGLGSAETMRPREPSASSDPGREETAEEVVGAETECMCLVCGAITPHESGATSCEESACPHCGARMVTHYKVD